MGKQKSKLSRMIAATLLGILVYRIGAHVPLPGVEMPDILSNDFARTASMLTGASLSQATLFGLGVMPFIMAQIIMQVLQTMHPRVKAIYNDGTAGRNKITQWTRMLTVPFAAIAATLYLMSATVTVDGIDPVMLKVMDGIILVGGAMLLMRIGELIAEHGIGQGMSVIVCASILAQIPSTFTTGAMYTEHLGVDIAVAAAMFLITVPIVVRMERAQKRIPVTYASAQKSNKVDTYLPIRLVVAGVVPVIFASAIRTIPLMVLAAMPDQFENYLKVASFMNGWGGIALEALLIVLFSFIYAALAFDCSQIAKNLAENGGYIADADVAPGSQTERYLKNVVREITWPGGILLTIVAIVPSIIALATGNMFVSAIGGTSLIIVADTIMQMADQVSGEMAVAKTDR